MCIDDKVKEALYDKSYTCPLCQEAFKSKAIKSGKNQLISTDDDLCAHYSLVNPVFYDIIVCPKCGYSVHTKMLSPLLPKQKEWLSAQFNTTTPHFHYSEYTTLDQAIRKHKMALLACITRKSKLHEQAYIALLTAWLYREKGDTDEERSFLQRALNGFSEAYSKESFPFVEMDATTITYLMAAIAFELGDQVQSKQYLSKVISDPACSGRIKDRAFELKQKLSD